MMELYQSEACGECASVRRKLAEIGATYVVRTVPMDRARRGRVVEAGGRPDVPLLLDPERGRTTYGPDEIVNQLGAPDFFGLDESTEEDLPHLYQREGEATSDAARRLLDAAGLDFVCRHGSEAAADLPRLVEPGSGAAHVGLPAIEAWLRGRGPSGAVA